MPRTRKHHWWDVTVKWFDKEAKSTRQRSVRTHSKTYGGACHKAFKKIGIAKPETDYNTYGFKGVTCELAKV